MIQDTTDTRSYSKGFWWWCITLEIDGFWCVLHRPIFFRSFVFFKITDDGESAKTQQPQH